MPVLSKFETPNNIQRLAPQLPFIGNFQRQELLEGPIDLSDSSPLPTSDLVAEALGILLGTLDRYRHSIVNANHHDIQSTETPLQADTLIRAFHEFSPSPNGKAEVVRSCLNYLDNYPAVTTPPNDPPTTAPLDLIVNHSRPQFITLLGDPSTMIETVSAPVFIFAKHLVDCIFLPS
jgi:hypothetical protein